jgi:chromosome partitioning protein
MKTISTINCKGGVGKTTVTACISQALALIGHRVLAIDNDSQHNLSIMLGGADSKPTIREIYHSSLGAARLKLNAAIRPTTMPGLDLLPSCNELSNSDVRDTETLRKLFAFCQLSKRYDFVLIDNPPGMDKLQEAAICASDELLVPTELTHFAYNGIQNLQQILLRKFESITTRMRIIPNFYRDTPLQNDYLARMRREFPDHVTATAIPFDVVLEECLTEGKILFVHRHQSRVTESYLRLVQELFVLGENDVRVVVRLNDCTTFSTQEDAHEDRHAAHLLGPQRVFPDNESCLLEEVPVFM